MALHDREGGWPGDRFQPGQSSLDGVVDGQDVLAQKVGHSMSKDIRHRMSVKHEADVAALLDGVQSRGSGNQAANPMDGRQDRHRVPYAFSWDCKATLGASIGVSDAMWIKAKEQTHGERPSLPLRWYASEQLFVVQDLIVVNLHDFAEILEVANRA